MAEIYRENVDGYVFLSYSEEKIVPILGNYDRREPNSKSVLDNASDTVAWKLISVELCENMGTVLIILLSIRPG